jgi:hypothetical protein
MSRRATGAATAADPLPTLLVRTSKSGQVRHIELTAEGLDFFKAITTGRAGHLAISCSTATVQHGAGRIKHARSLKPAGLPR